MGSDRPAETFADRRRVYLARQRRFIAVIGPCLIAAGAIIILGAGSRARGLPFPLSPALLLGALAACLMAVDRDRPAPKCALFGLLCALVVVILVVL